jgi:aspartyl-tRNA(Asn)/glutamyl-tRNA(Gln) amidotransferase subunit A
MRIGVPRHFFFSDEPGVNQEVVAIVDKQLAVLQELGAELEEVTIPSLEYVRPANVVIMLSEAYAYHEPNLKARPQDFGEMVRARFRIGGMFSASDYVQAQRTRKLVKREVAETMERVDLLVSPTMTQPAAAFEGYDSTSTVRGPSFTAPYNLTGLPAISVPCGFTEAGLPVGMQLAGKPFDEPGVIRAAYTYEQHARWFDQRPPV